jgi:transposase
MIEAVIERCAGIDVGRKFVMVCTMIGDANAVPQYEIRKFLTLNHQLEQLRKWLHENQCTHVVMESTGSYWKPIFHVLDDGKLQVVLANSQHVKNLRGHKTDRNDSRWLAHLLRHGMIRPSFIPSREVRELRDLTRRRKQLIHNAVDERNRVQRVLQEANAQLGAVLSDLFGESGLDMLDALVNQEAAPEQIAQLARKQAKKKIPQIQAAMEGHHMTEHHRLLIRHFDAASGVSGRRDCRIGRRDRTANRSWIVAAGHGIGRDYPGNQTDRGCRPVGRNGCGYESVSGTAAIAFLDRCQSGEQRERR